MSRHRWRPFANYREGDVTYQPLVAAHSQLPPPPPFVFVDHSSSAVNVGSYIFRADKNQLLMPTMNSREQYQHQLRYKLPSEACLRIGIEPGNDDLQLSDHELCVFNHRATGMTVASYNLCKHWLKDPAKHWYNNALLKDAETMEHCLKRQTACVRRALAAAPDAQAIAFQEVELDILEMQQLFPPGWTLFYGGAKNAGCSEDASNSNIGDSHSMARVVIAVNDPDAVAVDLSKLFDARTNTNSQQPYDCTCTMLVAAESPKYGTAFTSLHNKWFAGGSGRGRASTARTKSQLLQALDNVAYQCSMLTTKRVVLAGDWNMEDYRLPDLGQTCDIHAFAKEIIIGNPIYSSDTSQLLVTRNYTNVRIHEGRVLCTASDYALVLEASH